MEADARVPRAAVLAPRCGQGTGLSCIDSTPLKVCPNWRSTAPTVFPGVGHRGVSSPGWFYGCTGPLVLNDQGDLLAALCTPGNGADRKPVPTLARRWGGQLCGDRGALAHALFSRLWAQGGQLVSKLKKNRPNKLLPLRDKIWRRKPTLIETVNAQLKNICQIAHPPHRSLINFVVNVLAGLIAYPYQEKTPALTLNVEELQTLPALTF